MGSGTRLKVLEGLAMGRPVVSTSIGCEGIAVVDGEHVLLADDPVAFARSVLRALDDTALAARLARNGRSLVEQRYSWPSVLRHLETFMWKSRRTIDLEPSRPRNAALAVEGRATPVPPLSR